MPRPRLRLVDDEAPAPVRNPLFDPRRDGWPEQSLTAIICGDPIPGRRELVASLPDDYRRMRTIAGWAATW